MGAGRGRHGPVQARALVLASRIAWIRLDSPTRVVKGSRMEITTRSARMLFIVGVTWMTCSLALAETREPENGRDKQEIAASGEKTYQTRCATCHDHPRDRIPPRTVLGFMPPEFIVSAMTHGKMKQMAMGLKPGAIDDV